MPYHSSALFFIHSHPPKQYIRTAEQEDWEQKKAFGATPEAVTALLRQSQAEDQHSVNWRELPLGDQPYLIYDQSPCEGWKGPVPRREPRPLARPPVSGPVTETQGQQALTLPPAKRIDWEGILYYTNAVTFGLLGGLVIGKMGHPRGPTLRGLPQ